MGQGAITTAPADPPGTSVRRTSDTVTGHAADKTAGSVANSAGRVPDRSAGRGPDGLAGVLLAPVRGHAFETCVGQLATAIRLGVFPTGSVFPPERELAAQLGVSRTTLRESIAALRSAGMITTARGRGGGSTVAYRPPEPGAGHAERIAGRRWEWVEALQFRCIVEPGACDVAAGRVLGPADRDRLRVCEREAREAPGTGAHRQADARLHLAIAAASGSRMLMDAVTTVQAALHEMLLAIPVLDRNIEHSTAQHAAIVTAILAGNPAAARRAMEQHCDDTAALLRGLLGLPDERTEEPAGTAADASADEPAPPREGP
jgi:GntR family transcriptional repressor for pyruvate dehydrogenase complex